MSTQSKWDIADLHLGAVVEATFWPNPVKDSGFRFRATHLDGRRAPKVVLCDDVRIRPGRARARQDRRDPQSRA